MARTGILCALLTMMSTVIVSLPISQRGAGSTGWWMQEEPAAGEVSVAGHGSLDPSFGFDFLHLVQVDLPLIKPAIHSYL
jgi:hypothetical protein